ncbi:hypothetical protein [Nonomuraea dietziae]|uniref:hypothetical protein n=1 Tax=Nonomuraea dietziae TaxID=65515 RepID=UPI0031E147DA
MHAGERARAMIDGDVAVIGGSLTEVAASDRDRMVVGRGGGELSPWSQGRRAPYGSPRR